MNQRRSIFNRFHTVPQFDPAQLAQWTAGRWTRLPAGSVSGFAIDSRRVRAGEIFVALRTDLRDGHDFLAAAAAAGAAGALVREPRAEVDLPQLVVSDTLTAFQTIAREHRRGFKGPVTGISGSAGKTSTKELLARLLGDRALATEGNLNNHLGVPLTLTRLDPAHHGFAIVEAGISGPGEMAPLARMIEPDVVVITLVDHAHTRDLGDVEGVAREKAALPAGLRPRGVAVLPSGVARLPAFRHLPVRRLVVERADQLPAVAAVADTVVYTVQHDGEESVLQVTELGDAATRASYRLRRVSDGMAQNAVLAITVARWLGVSCAEIRARLTGWGPATLRGEVRREQGRLLYVDCYNANPASMADALRAFAGLTDGESAARLFVLGGMEELGAESDLMHRALGASLVLRPDDRVLVIGTGAEAVREGAQTAGAAADQVKVLGNLEGVAERVARWPGPVFVKGSRRYRLETVMGASPAASTH